MAVAAAVVAITAGIAPAAQAGTPIAGGVGPAEAPVGVRCGAYRDMGGDTGHLRYRHCGPTSIIVEIDYRTRPNKFACVTAWNDVFLERYIFADNAWYVDVTDRC